LSLQLTASGASPEAVDEAKHLFDPNALTLGFARRFAPYKRPNLLLHDPERLLRLGERVVGFAQAWEIIQTNLAAHQVRAERFERRLAKVAAIDCKEVNL
jgi:glucan phosphorylase